MDDGAPAEIEEVLAGTTVSSPAPLPPTDMRQGMLHRHPLPQLGSALGRQLPGTQLLQEPFVGMDMDTAASDTGGAALPERTDLALVLGEVHGPPAAGQKGGEAWRRNLDEYWPVLEEVLAQRYGARPAHSLAEIRQLSELFPENVRCWVARLAGRTIAGTVVFGSPRVDHTQYLASSDAGREVGALDAVLFKTIEQARCSGRRYLSFGISTEGALLNDGLFRYKSSFGAGAVTYHFFEITLAP